MAWSSPDERLVVDVVEVAERVPPSRISRVSSDTISPATRVATRSVNVSVEVNFERAVSVWDDGWPPAARPGPSRTLPAHLAGRWMCLRRRSASPWQAAGHRTGSQWSRMRFTTATTLAPARDTPLKAPCSMSPGHHGHVSGDSDFAVGKAMRSVDLGVPRLDVAAPDLGSGQCRCNGACGQRDGREAKGSLNGWFLMTCTPSTGFWTGAGLSPPIVHDRAMQQESAFLNMSPFGVGIRGRETGSATVPSRCGASRLGQGASSEAVARHCLVWWRQRILISTAGQQFRRMLVGAPDSVPLVLAPRPRFRPRTHGVFGSVANLVRNGVPDRTRRHLGVSAFLLAESVSAQCPLRQRPAGLRIGHALIRVLFPPWTDGSAHHCLRSRFSPSFRLGSSRRTLVFPNSSSRSRALRFSSRYASFAGRNSWSLMPSRIVRQ